MKTSDTNTQALERAIQLFESGKIDQIEVGTSAGLCAIHRALFHGLCDEAGRLREVNSYRGAFRFAGHLYLEAILPVIDHMPESTFREIIYKYVEMYIAHPFLFGNGPTRRIWLNLILRQQLGLIIDWRMIDRDEYQQAIERSPMNDLILRTLLSPALTGKVDDSEIIYRGLEQSFRYELLEADSNKESTTKK